MFVATEVAYHIAVFFPTERVSVYHQRLLRFGVCALERANGFRLGSSCMNAMESLYTSILSVRWPKKKTQKKKKKEKEKTTTDAFTRTESVA